MGDNDNIDDEVRAPESEKRSAKDYACLAFAFALACYAGFVLATAVGKRDLPNFAVVAVVVLAVGFLRWFFIFMMRPVFFPIIRKGAQPSRRVMRLGDSVFHFLYYSAMAFL